MSYLKWISDNDVKLEVKKVLDIAASAIVDSDRKFNRNVIDPFSAIFQITGFNVDLTTWKSQEIIRQSEKTLQNHIGEFHQNILGHVKDWKNLSVGNEIDLVNDSRKIIAEIKNKYNTVSGGKLASNYYELDALVSQKASKYKGYTAYFVQIIPKSKNRFDKEFTPSDKSKSRRCPANPLIREIDGASFYKLVTGSDSALSDLYKMLPNVIEDVSGIQLGASDKQSLLDIFNAAY